jgi:glycosyltransferase involved in cell wall biosynthesis
MKSKRRVLYINPFSGYGGAEQSLAGLLLSLNKTTDFELHLLLPNEGVLSEKLEGSGISVHYIKPPRAFVKLSQAFGFYSFLSLFSLLFSFPLYLYRLRVFIKKLDPAIIHTNGIKSHLLSGLLPVSLKGKALFWHCRRVIFSPLLRGILSLMSRRVTACISNSNFLKSTVPSHAPVETVYNPIDCNQFKKIPFDNLLEEFPSLKGKTIISVVSILAHTKGVDIIIHALSEMLNASENVVLVIVGDDIYETSGNEGYRNKLEKLASSIASSDRILFAGFQNNVAQWMSLSDICVHFPESEAFGRVVAEALACETPVVASRVGGIPEIIDDGETGFLVELHDEDALRKKVETLLENEQLRIEMGRKGRLSVIERFSVETHAQRVSEIYERFTSNI